MMRNAVAKGKLLQYCCRGRSQYRDFSSVIEKESPPSGGMKKIGEKVIGYFYYVAIGGFGCVLGALTTSPSSDNLQNSLEILVRMRKDLDEQIVSTLPAKYQKIEIQKED